MVDLDLDAKRTALLNAEGHLLIAGGPGSGKTTIALLKARQYIPRLKPEQKVLFLSFSRAAVRQVTDRMAGLLTAEFQRSIEVRTFHAFYLELLRSHGRLINGEPVSFITPESEAQRKAEFDGDWKSESLRLAQDESVYAFDTLAPFTALLMARCPAVRELYSDCYPLIIVDEFQDTSVDQWRVIKLLAERSTIACLADPDQRIFEYLDGVDEYRLEDAKQTLKPTTFDFTADNHRSPGGGLLDYANAVLRNSPAPQTENVTLLTYWENSPEVLTHRALAALQESLEGRVSGVPSIAVLTRTNTLAARISERLSGPTEAPDGTVVPAVEHALIWDPALTAVSALVVASVMEWPLKDQHQAVTDTLSRIADYYRTKVGSGKKSARSSIASIDRAIVAIKDGRNPRAKTAKFLLDKIEGHDLVFEGDPVQDWQTAREGLRGTTELDEIFRQSRLVRLLRATDALGWGLIESWNGASGYENAADTVKTVLANEVINSNQDDPPAVSIMTMHKSKGKEFDGVVLVEGRYGWDPFLGESIENHAADRRLLRVAITRARHVVVIVRPAGALRLTSS